MTTNLTEVWLRLMGDAMRGTADAQEAVRTLSEAPTNPDKLTRWMTRFMPSIAGNSRPEALGDVIEDTWRMMGVVPRYRYLELLERHEMLRNRLEQAEREISKLRKTAFATDVPKQEAQKVLDMWEGMLQETLKMQSDWMRTWASTADDEKSAETPSVSEEKDPSSTKDSSGEEKKKQNK